MTATIAAAFEGLVATINAAAGADAGNRPIYGATEADGYRPIVAWTPDTRVATFGYIGNLTERNDDRGWTVWFPGQRDARGNATRAFGYLPTDAPVEMWREAYRAAVAKAREFGYAA